jgi:hypothetical protein
VRLAELQREFHAAATGLAPLPAGLIRDDDVGAAARMQVYAHAYRARLHDVLAADFPRLRAALGAADFTRMADRYLAAMPPSHPSIGEAGARLPEFLAGWSGELAGIERARTEVFTAADDEVLRRDELAALPAEAFASLPLRPIRATRLLALAWNADELWDGAAAPPHAAARTVLVWRRGLEVVHRTLDPDEARALTPLAGAGAGAGGGTFLDVCAALADHPTPGERAIELLLRWIDAEVLATRG